MDKNAMTLEQLFSKAIDGSISLEDATKQFSEAVSAHRKVEQEKLDAAKKIKIQKAREDVIKKVNDYAIVLFGDKLAHTNFDLVKNFEKDLIKIENAALKLDAAADKTNIAKEPAKSETKTKSDVDKILDVLDWMYDEVLGKGASEKLKHTFKKEPRVKSDDDIFEDFFSNLI